MLAFRIDHECPKCGGTLHPTGAVLTMDPPMYPHNCGVCRFTANYEHVSGEIVFEENT
jgi:hypothetical protein